MKKLLLIGLMVSSNAYAGSPSEYKNGYWSVTTISTENDKNSVCLMSYNKTKYYKLVFYFGIGGINSLDFFIDKKNFVYGNSKTITIKYGNSSKSYFGIDPVLKTYKNDIYYDVSIYDTKNNIIDVIDGVSKEKDLAIESDYIKNGYIFKSDEIKLDNTGFKESFQKLKSCLDDIQE